MTWFALKTEPQKEFAAVRILQRLGYTVFLPIEDKTRRSRGRVRKRFVVTYPMMRSYVFCHFDGHPPWFRIARLNVIIGVVGFDGRPAAIPDLAIVKLMATSGQSIPHRRSVNTHKALKTGDMAEIISGQFFGQIVPVTGLRGQKAKIMLELFGTKREVDIPLSSLEAA